MRRSKPLQKEGPMKRPDGEKARGPPWRLWLCVLKCACFLLCGRIRKPFTRNTFFTPYSLIFYYPHAIAKRVIKKAG
jgi:hypothetical protein